MELRQHMQRGSDGETDSYFAPSPESFCLKDHHPTGRHPDQKVLVWVPFSCLSPNRRESRHSLAIFDRKEIAHLGTSKIARFLRGAAKIEAATAENRAILVHSAWRLGEGQK